MQQLEIEVNWLFEHEQYFQGYSARGWDYGYCGVGSTLKEAIEDALEGASQHVPPLDIEGQAAFLDELKQLQKDRAFAQAYQMRRADDKEMRKAGLDEVSSFHFYFIVKWRGAKEETGQDQEANRKRVQRFLSKRA